MSQLIADRFLAMERDLIIDAATSKRVDITIASAGDKRQQQKWAEQCAGKLGDAGSHLIDFGFIGCDRRFEAVSRQVRPLLRRTDAIHHVIEWLEQTRHCRPDVFVAADSHNLAADGSLARELRLHGFIAVSRAMFDDRTLVGEISKHLRGRSVVLLHAHGDGEQLAVAVLMILSAGARHIWAVRNSEPRMANASLARTAQVAHAAESRVAFGISAGHRHIVDDAETLIARGRHALADRTLRASMAAFERRNDALRAADAGMRLGRLLQTRGRVEDAFDLFERAREQYQSRHRAAQAIEACLFAGLVQADRGLLAESEHVLRTTRSAAAAIDDRDLAQRAATGLARAFYWQGRYADASMLLETIANERELADGARFWCLAARIRLAAGDVANAWPAVARARASLSKDSGPAGESLVRTAEAMVQGKLGDIEALERHAREGLRAAAQAHLPLQALRLRLTLVDGLLDAGHISRARNAARCLASISKRPLPPLLARRASRTIDRLAAPAVHETSPVFVTTAVLTTPMINQGEADGLAELLAIVHGVDDEREALMRGASTIRKHLGAIAIGIFSTTSSGVAPLAAVGASLQVMADRCASVVQPIEIERSASGYESAVPIRYLGRFIGVLACRWSVDGPSSPQRVNAFCSAAAAACAPLVYTATQRQTPSSAGVQPDCEIVGVSRLIDEVRGAVARSANAPFTVLIEGESGSGKELVARAIHRSGCRRERKFCALNCAALPDDLVDTELFGHAKGAFTGAAIERQGLFESADQGTVFLDEIGELSARAQAKLLRVLQEGEIRRIGETFTRAVDARLVAATNRSLAGEVAVGRFRQDLLYRLDVIRITVPPLRDRPEDIPLLAARFWRQAADQVGCKAVLGPGALSALARYDWPGNVRELQNVLTSMAVAAPSRGVIGASQLPAAIGRTASAVTAETLDMARFRFEQRFVRATLARTAGHRGRAAAALGVSRQGLAKLLLRLGIE